MDGFIKVGKLADLAQKPFLRAKVILKPIAVFKNRDGDIVAIEMSCKHQGADLTRGKLTGSKVTCERHGWIYDLTTGERTNGESPKLRFHDVVVEDNNIFVSLSPKSR